MKLNMFVIHKTLLPITSYLFHLMSYLMLACFCIISNSTDGKAFLNHWGLFLLIFAQFFPNFLVDSYTSFRLNSPPQIFCWAHLLEVRLPGCRFVWKLRRYCWENARNKYFKILGRSSLVLASLWATLQLKGLLTITNSPHNTSHSWKK